MKKKNQIIFSLVIFPFFSLFLLVCNQSTGARLNRTIVTGVVESVKGKKKESQKVILKTNFGTYQLPRTAFMPDAPVEKGKIVTAYLTWKENDEYHKNK